jgi:hypothetical protein
MEKSSVKVEAAPARLVGWSMARRLFRLVNGLPRPSFYPDDRRISRYAEVFMCFR